MHHRIYELHMQTHSCSSCYNILVHELGWYWTNSLTNFELPHWLKQLLSLQDKRSQDTNWVKHGTNSTEYSMLCWWWVYDLAWEEEFVISDIPGYPPVFVGYFHHFYWILQLTDILSRQGIYNFSSFLLLWNFVDLNPPICINSMIELMQIRDSVNCFRLILLVFQFKQISEDYPCRKICWYIQHVGIFSNCCIKFVNMIQCCSFDWIICTRRWIFSSWYVSGFSSELTFLTK